MRVRPVAEGDFRAVCGLLAELGRPTVDAATADVCRATFDADLADPQADHLIAEDDDGTPIGFCSIIYRRRLNQPTEEAWIPDLLVTEHRRSAGVGRALLAEAERRARERGCHYLTLESAHWRDRAHAFYRDYGLADAALAFGKRLR